MSVTLEDVRHIAALARLGITDARAASLVGELNTILVHMDALSAIDTVGVDEAIGVGARGLPVRGDHGPPVPLVHSLDAIAPSLHDDFLLVPRLATHETVEGA